VVTDVARDLSRWRALQCPLPIAQPNGHAGAINRAPHRAFCPDDPGIMFNLSDADHYLAGATISVTRPTLVSPEYRLPCLSQVM
jgi:hypothetical protein